MKTYLIESIEPTETTMWQAVPLFSGGQNLQGEFDDLIMRLSGDNSIVLEANQLLQQAIRNNDRHGFQITTTRVRIVIDPTILRPANLICCHHEGSQLR